MTNLWADWQFWVVTGVALGGLFLLLRPLLPRKSGVTPGCGHCDGCRPATPSEHLVTLGSGRRRVGGTP